MFTYIPGINKGNFILRRVKANRLGFTLVELLVVISIIAVLSIVGITVFTGVQKGAADSRKRGDINAIMKAYEAISSAEGQYRQLRGTDFAGGTVPAPPEGGSYIQWGPDAPELTKQTFDWYGLCAQLSDGSSYCKESVMGERPAGVPSPLTYSAYTPPPCSSVPNLNYSSGISCKTDFIRTNPIYIDCPTGSLATLLNNSCSYNGSRGSCGGGMQIYYYTAAEGGTSRAGDIMNNECGGPSPVEVRLHK